MEEAHRKQEAPPLGALGGAEGEPESPPTLISDKSTPLPLFLAQHGLRADFQKVVLASHIGPREVTLPAQSIHPRSWEETLQ